MEAEKLAEERKKDLFEQGKIGKKNLDGDGVQTIKKAARAAHKARRKTKSQLDGDPPEDKKPKKKRKSDEDATDEPKTKKNRSKLYDNATIDGDRAVKRYDEKSDYYFHKMEQNKSREKERLKKKKSHKSFKSKAKFNRRK